jgi:hypothetical protein
MPFEFGTVYVRDVSQSKARDALVQLMRENEHLPTEERGLEPTPENPTAGKPVRSFALMPTQEGWIAVLEDGHSSDDGGLAEGLSELLSAETMHFAYSDDACTWSFVKYFDGQPLEAGGSHDVDFDAAALEFMRANALPYFGVYYEEVAASMGDDAPALAGSLRVVGDIIPKLPIGTEVLTFRRPGRPLPR